MKELPLSNVGGPYPSVEGLRDKNCFQRRDSVSRLQHQLPPGFLVCQPALWILELSVLQCMRQLHKIKIFIYIYILHTCIHTFIHPYKHTDRSVDTEYGSWHLARESYHQRRKSTGISGRKAFHLYFQVEYYLLLVSAPFSSIIKSDVQYIFDRLKTGCFS